MDVRVDVSISYTNLAAIIVSVKINGVVQMFPSNLDHFDQFDQLFV